MKKIFKYLLIIVLLCVTGLLGVYFFTPEPKTFLNQNPRITSFMQMRIDAAKAEGINLKIFHQYLNYSNIDQDLKDAVRISEDGGFFAHNGFDFAEIKESIKKNIKKRKFARGGSTISQQLVKNLFLSSDKSIVRKIKEAVLTFKLENQLSKFRIFSLYMNYIEFGDGVFGVQAACWTYFGKSARDVTVFEAARLASIIPNPRKYNPNKPTRRLRYRTKLLLTRLFKYKKITRAEYSDALREFEMFFD